MDISDAEKFVYEWGAWESGRCRGLDEALEIIADQLRREEASTQQRDVWLEMYDLLLKARTRSS